jgi:hypothetical protein
LERQRLIHEAFCISKLGISEGNSAGQKEAWPHHKEAKLVINPLEPLFPSTSYDGVI